MAAKPPMTGSSRISRFSVMVFIAILFGDLPVAGAEERFDIDVRDIRNVDLLLILADAAAQDVLTGGHLLDGKVTFKKQRVTFSDALHLPVAPHSKLGARTIRGIHGPKNQGQTLRDPHEFTIHFRVPSFG